MSMSEEWEELQKECISIEDSDLPSADPALQTRVKLALERLESLQEAVDSAGTFSRNEELDDVHTLDLKYLMVPYHRSELLAKLVDNQRYDHLQASNYHLTKFMAKCQTLGVLSRQEFESLSESKLGDRQSRIDRYKKEKELVSRLKDLEAAKKKVAKRSSAETLEDNGEYDELEREYQLLTLQRALRLAFDKRMMCMQELELLSLTQAQKDEACAARDAAQAEAKRAPIDAIRLAPSAPTERQKIIDAVFQARNLPTMTIEEYMKAYPEEFTPAAPTPQQQSSKGDKDEEEEDEEETYKKRAWDDWKDDHPRGWGNRLGNVG